MARAWLGILSLAALFSLMPWPVICSLYYTCDGLDDCHPWRDLSFWFPVSYPLWAGAILAWAWSLVSTDLPASVTVSLFLPFAVFVWFGLLLLL